MSATTSTFHGAQSSLPWSSDPGIAHPSSVTPVDLSPPATPRDVMLNSRLSSAGGLSRLGDKAKLTGDDEEEEKKKKKRRRRLAAWLCCCSLLALLAIGGATVGGLVATGVINVNATAGESMLQQGASPCASDPCRYLSNCTTTPDGANYTCHCLSGSSGRNCEIEIDECLSSPCQQNGSTCVDRFGHYECRCEPGYEGRNCETELDECESSPCLFDATCHDGINNYTCECADGYEGFNCQSDIDDCSSSPCLFGATCSDAINNYTCECAGGYEGFNCSIEIDECLSNPCHNGGTCHDAVNGYTCENVAGFTGEYGETDIDECLSDSDPCQNGGTCHDAVNGYTCENAAGFTGLYGETDIDDCTPNPCTHGSCTDAVADFTCACNSGWAGKICDSVDDCTPDPCDHGTCIDGDNSYNCSCDPGWDGPTCNNRNDCSANYKDILFILDASGSVTAPNFDLMKKFVKDLVDKIANFIAEGQNQLAVMTYSFDTQTQVNFGLTEHRDKDSYKTAVDAVPYTTGGTHTHAAFVVARQQVFTPAGGDKEENGNIIIILTDGISNNVALTQSEAANTREANITIFSVGVGAKSGDQNIQDEVTGMASEPKADHAFFVVDFNDLITVLADRLTETFCS